MENLHGVDVSWLHRSTADHSAERSSTPPASPAQAKPEAPPTKENGEATLPKPIPQRSSSSQNPPQNQQQPAPKASPRRPGLLGRLSYDKPTPPLSSPPEEQKSAKRSSWRSSLSKFSSSLQTEPPQSSAKPPKPSSSSNNTPPRPPNADLQRERFDEAIEEEDVSQSSKAGSSFFSSAFRRLSSTGPQPSTPTPQEPAPSCPRKVLNVDQGRDRPSVKELKESKLRRVSFSVDVEIAGNSRYPAEDDSPEDDPVVKKNAEKKKKKIKERAEGETLKRPGLRKGETEKEGLLHALGRDGMFDIGIADDEPSRPTSPPATPSEKADAKRAKEKAAPSPTIQQPYIEPAPSRQESAPAEPLKPDPRPEADLANANVNQPAPDTAGGSEPTRQDAKPPPKAQDKPTTDPLRIYRRCCQLREAPVLKRISEQLGNPNKCGVDTPGVVTCLNLTKSRMQLPDIVCLGDWLAVVPVKKLLLEDANLTDEGVRIILAGLLAAKVPELHKRKRGRSSPTRIRDNTIVRSPGVIEKLTLKNNPKLTAEVWKHISLFVHMSKSIKAVDVSMIRLPRSFPAASTSASEAENDPAALLCKSISDRHGGDHLEELIFGECHLDTHQVDKITEAAAKIGLKRLGLAGNKLDEGALGCVARYLKANVCKGLDVGGNDLSKHLPIITDALLDDNPLWAICLANCNLKVESLRPLFPALVALPDIRFLDLSYNRELFAQKPTALGVLRKFLPQFALLKRIHLMGVSMSPADAIGLADIIPEVRNLAHLNILDNPQISATVSSKDPAVQEEACAMYASMMTAVRLSKTLFCVDIDVPGEGASEVVKALARQTFAYCLRNMERYSEVNVIRLTDAAAALPDVSTSDPGLLRNIAGAYETGTKDDEPYEPSQHEDFIVGGRGWVKALSHCLEAADFRRVSVGGEVTPSQVMDSAAGRAKAKEVSKTLLVNARDFKVRLEAVIAREEKENPSEEVMRRMQFLHHALNTMIERFEQEYPDTRVQPTISATGEPAPIFDREAVETSISPSGSRESSPDRPFATPEQEHPPSTLDDFFDNETKDTKSGHQRPLSASSRRGSEVEIHNRELTQEEGKMHKIGQRFRRDVLPPSGQTDHLHGTSEKDAPEAEHLANLRRQLEQFGGEEMRSRLNQVGMEGVLKELQFQDVSKSPAS